MSRHQFSGNTKTIWIELEKLIPFESSLTTSAQEEIDLWNLSMLIGIHKRCSLQYALCPLPVVARGPGSWGSYELWTSILFFKTFFNNRALLYNQSDAETEEGQLIVKEISEPTVVHLKVRLVSYQNLSVEDKPWSCLENWPGDEIFMFFHLWSSNTPVYLHELLRMFPSPAYSGSYNDNLPCLGHCLILAFPLTGPFANDLVLPLEFLLQHRVSQRSLLVYFQWNRMKRLMLLKM